MSKLHVFWPDDAATDATSHSDGGATALCELPLPSRQQKTPASSDVISLAQWVSRLNQSSSSDAVNRARQLAENTACPQCSRSGTVPLMLNNGRLDGSGQLIPGTATLIGFRCGHCESEWSA